MSDPTNYTVGWICALPVEYVAAQEFLDEEHEKPNFVSPNDTNDYTLGKIYEHNVVIAVLPDGEYGTASAANVATNMLNTFHNVRIGLMVGIGGGVPSEKHDVRLGDVVVSAPRGGQGGVIQYDFGKSIQGQEFQHTRFLNQPPTILRTAMTGIQTQYERKGHRLGEAINRILDSNRRLRRKYERPESITDMLFQPTVIHESDCGTTSCANDISNLVLRRERSENEDNPAIHYGLIASANQLMKDALVRDRLAAEKDVLCFEMEAAGLMNTFPCLVIRGVCDYSDSHKNKQWQGYAAMVAAAWAKDLLQRMPVNKIEAEEKIGRILSGLYTVADAHRSILQKQLDIQKNTITEEKCLQLFRLTSGTKDATYEWYKDHVESRVEGTCEWFLDHHNFQMWLQQDSGPLLVSADPGCGKSVLAKYLIDDRLPRLATTCYFFFTDQDQDTVRQALCALLHQLFFQKPSLIKYAMAEYAKDGRGLINSTNSLWTILENTVRDPQAGPIIFVLDALDECAESEFTVLIQRIESQFRGDHSGHGKFKLLLTSRPYEKIVCKFMGLLESFPYIRIPGEENSESISREVNHIIQYRVEKLAKEKRLSDSIKDHLAKKLLGITHRTYLWVHLVFNYLTTEDFKKTPHGLDSTLAVLPTTIYEAYERILNRSKKDPMVSRALSIILAATRPFTISEMNVALNIDITSKSIDHLDLEEDGDFKSRLRTWCGLFVSIHHDKVYFLHQTAREFLLAYAPSPATFSSESRWQHSITNQDAHKVLAEVCVLYLDSLNNVNAPKNPSAEPTQYPDRYTLLDYSAKNWGAHYLKACISAGADIVPSVISICSPGSRSWSAWFGLYWTTTSYMSTSNFTSLMISSYFGLKEVVDVLVEQGLNYESKDMAYGRTPLSWAAGNGHVATVKLLLKEGADFESKDNFSRTPLFFATKNRHKTIIELLLEKGADFESKDIHSQTSLSLATQNGHEPIVKLLLEKGANFESKDKRYGQTPLSLAAKNGNETILKLLLEKGADLESKDIHSQTSLSLATQNWHETIVKLLLEKGANFESKDKRHGQTPLSLAAQNGNETIFKLLLEKGANLESKDKRYGQTPLSLAAQNGHETIVKLLLEKGANFESKDKRYDQKSLLWAAQNGHEIIVELLLEKGASFELKDKIHSQTPLSWAIRNEHEAIVKLLLEKSANFEPDQATLSLGTRDGSEANVKLLLEKAAHSGYLPLSIHGCIFQMWVNEPQTPNLLHNSLHNSLHTYTRLQGDWHHPNAPPMPLENVSEWRTFFPHLSSLLDDLHGPLDCDIILLEVNLELMSDFPPAGSRLIIQLDLDFGHPTVSDLLMVGQMENWTCHTYVYRDGQRMLETQSDLPKPQSTKVKPLFESSFWAKTLIQLTQEKCMAQKSGQPEIVHSAEENSRHFFRSLSSVQELRAVPPSSMRHSTQLKDHCGDHSERMALLLWMFCQTKPGEVGTTNWRRLLPPHDLPTTG